jgi:acetyl esterase
VTSGVHPQVTRSLELRNRPTTIDPHADPMTQLVALRAELVEAVPVECGPPSPLVPVAEVDADAVPCRLYRPEGAVGTLVYAHGGGWVMGSAEIVDRLVRRVADRSGCAVLSVDYRLAPEHPFPAAVDDVSTALAWLRRTAPELGLHPKRVAIGGDSAGGHLATVVARRARDAGTPVAYQVLLYPVIDPAMRSASYADMGSYGLTRASMAHAWAAFAPGADLSSPDLSPLRADLAGMPPTLLLTAELDVLRDEGEAYGAALLAAGVPVVAVRYQGVNHGFARKLAVFDAAAVAADQIAAALRDALAR